MSASLTPLMIFLLSQSSIEISVQMMMNATLRLLVLLNVALLSALVAWTVLGEI